MVRVLAFDVFGTVVDWRSSIIAELERFADRQGVRQDWATFADSWRAGYVPAMDRVRRGELPWTRLDDLHRQILDQLLRDAGIEASEADVDDLVARVKARTSAPFSVGTTTWVPAEDLYLALRRADTHMFRDKAGNAATTDDADGTRD